METDKSLEKRVEHLEFVIDKVLGPLLHGSMAVNEALFATLLNANPPGSPVYEALRTYFELVAHHCETLEPAGKSLSSVPPSRMRNLLRDVVARAEETGTPHSTQVDCLAMGCIGAFDWRPVCYPADYYRLRSKE